MFSHGENPSRYRDSNIIKKDHYGGDGLMIWEGIMAGKHTDLHVCKWMCTARIIFFAQLKFLRIAAKLILRTLR